MSAGLLPLPLAAAAAGSADSSDTCDILLVAIFAKCAPATRYSQRQQPRWSLEGLIMGVILRLSLLLGLCCQLAS